MDKYRLTDIKIEHEGRTLYRIEALKDFGLISKGALGGYVEGTHNLSQYGTCWILNNAKVYGDAMVSEDAIIFGDACVYGCARVYGEATITGYAKIYDFAIVGGRAQVALNAIIHDYARVTGCAVVQQNAIICGNVTVGGNASIFGNAVISDKRDYIVFKNWWSSGRHFTWTRSNDMWSVGCFYGTGEELIRKAYKDSKESGREYERIVKYVESIKQL